MDRWLYRIVKELRKGLPEEAVARTARATSLIWRKRANEPIPFFWLFLFGMTQPGGSVTKVQEFYRIITDHDAAYSLIQQWIKTEIKRLLRDIFAQLNIELGKTESALGGRFDRFCEVAMTPGIVHTPPAGPARAQTHESCPRWRRRLQPSPTPPRGIVIRSLVTQVVLIQGDTPSRG